MEDGEGEGLKILEDALKVDLQDLKFQIEEMDMAHGVPSKGMSSIHVPKDAEYFRRERKMILQRTLQVSEARPLVLQADIMRRELEICESREYTEKSLPLLLHQHFLDRMQDLVIAKQAHLLRWKRYCVNTAVAEAAYPDYKARVKRIMDEYMDCSSRANRLVTAREGFLQHTDQGIDEVTVEDILIYLRWIICSFQSLKRFHQFLGVLQWFPYAHAHTLEPKLEEEKESQQNSGEDNSDSVNTQDLVKSQNVEEDTVRTISPAGLKASDTEQVVRLFNTTSDPQNPMESGLFSEAAPHTPPMVAASMSGHNPLTATQFNLSLAAAGGGLCTDEKTRGLPLHTNHLNQLTPHLIVLCQVYSISMDVSAIQSSADEMELYSAINRKYKILFQHQEHMKTFKTYDSIDVNDKWGRDSGSHALLKEANWLEFVKFKPKVDAHQVRKLTQLRTDNNVDELLRTASFFVKISDPDKVQDALRHHSLLVQHPPVVHTASVASNRQGISTADIFKKIYTNPELYTNNGENGDDKNRKRRNSYDFQQTMQMLGLDEQDKTKDDPSSVQGAYLSYLHLRHLKIRDLQRTCLSVCNYFRSIERTTTINDQGLSLSAGGVGDKSTQNPRTGSEFEGLQGGSGNLGSHGYLFHSPWEFKISETEFMQFSEIENHDDFYFHEEGRLHVRDQNGFFIVYDVARKDFETLEKDLLLVATFFLEKDKQLRTMSKFKRKQNRGDDTTQGDIDITQYAHREVDRFGVLYDIWSNEAAFMECKKALMDVYMEVYQNTFNGTDRRRMAQLINNLAYLRPRIDFEDTYFVNSYRLECSVLRLKTDIFKHFLNAQINDQRNYLARIDKEFEGYGLPFDLIERNPIAVNADESALKNIYLLEFHNSLSTIANLSEAVEQSYISLHNMLRPDSTTHEVQLERRMLERVLAEWDSMQTIGVSYAPNMQRDLFNESFVEDPVLMTKVTHELVRNFETKNTRGDKRSRKNKLVNTVGRVVELVTLRVRLLDAAWQTNVMSRIYREMAEEMGYGEFHLFLRYIQFEAAKKKEGADTAKPPLFITSIQEDDTAVDKFAPSSLPLAVHEMDETHVGRFSFKSAETILQMAEGNGVENLSVILKIQIAHKNALAAAVLLAHNCQPNTFVNTQAKLKNDLCTPPHIGSTRSDKSIIGSGVFRSETIVNQMPVKVLHTDLAAPAFKTYDPEAFFSIQLEKSPSRDRVMNMFINKTATSSILKNPAETEKLKRELISKFCDDFSERIKQASLRAQIIAYYNGISDILSKVPTIFHTFFVPGEVDEKKKTEDDLLTTETNPRELRYRPRRVLSADGSRFLNLWFLPHYKETLYLFKEMDEEVATQALGQMARIVGSLHDILHYLVAHARLGTCQARLSAEQKAEYVTTDWGGNEGIDIKMSLPEIEQMSQDNGAGIVNNSCIETYKYKDFDGGMMSHMCTELREIQRQIDHLMDPMSPELVGDMLTLRRDAMFLEFDVCIRHILRETALASSNIDAYTAVTNNMHYALVEMSNAECPCLYAVQIAVPEPLEPRDSRSLELYPWRTFVNQNGPLSIMYPPWFRIEYNMQLCLAGLRDVDRPVVHGELLALNLTLEDVIHQGTMKEMRAGDPISMADPDQLMLLGKRYQDKGNKISVVAPPSNQPAVADKNTAASAGSPVCPNQTPDVAEHAEEKANDRISTTTHPIEAYKTICKFLVMWKRVDYLKYEWGKRKLGVENIDNPVKYKTFCKLYKLEKLCPLMKSLAVQFGQYQFYEIGPIADTDMHITPKGVPEVVVKHRQLLKLIETFETNMINDVRKRILRQIDMVIKERNREEGNLPVDLWKKPAMKEVLSVKRPIIAENFIQALMNSYEENEAEGTVLFKKEHLNKCLQDLGIDIMVSQKEIYENYAMYYENLLKHQHQQIYFHERHTKELTEQLKARELSTVVDVQFQLSDQAHSLLLEVTALRAKVAEMRQESFQQDMKTRETVQKEYNDMVNNLFSVAFEQKWRIDEYREHLHEATLRRIQEVRTEAAMEMSKVKEKSGARATADDELAARNLAISRKMTEFHQRNIHLKQMMIRMRSLFNWRETFAKCQNQRKLYGVEETRDSNKVQLIRVQMLSEQRSQLLGEELVRLKEYLTTTEKELNDLRKRLDRELKEKMERRHAADRKAASDKQLAMVKQMHIDELLTEMNEKDTILGNMEKVIDTNQKSQKSVVDRSHKEVDTLKKNLREERRMKQTAFSKVDDLLSQMYEYETAFAINKTSGAGSASPRVRPMTVSSNQTRSDNWQPILPKMPVKSLTPELRMQRTEPKQRPKTLTSLMNLENTPYTPQHFLNYRRNDVGGQRIRSRIAEQLLYNTEPDSHEVMTQRERGNSAAGI